MNHPAILNYTEDTDYSQNAVENKYQRKNGEAIIAGLKTTIDSVVDNEFRRYLYGTMRQVGAGFLIEPLLKAYLLSFILNMDCTNDLIRKLEENPNFAYICGFDLDRPLPSRWTFDRLVTRLASNPEMIERLIDEAVHRLQEKLPRFGITVAVDSTPVRSHSNPSKKVQSDSEAGFIVKEGIPSKIWKWGYKLHLLVDTTWELPIVCEVTLARESDVTNLIPLIDKATKRFSWFKPWHVLADKGYDAGYNYKAIHDMGAIPIIKMRRKEQSEGRYWIDEVGIPHCKSGLPLLLKDHDKKKGLRYVCPYRAGKADCSLHQECTLKVAWIRPFWEYRKLCSIPRDSEEWNALYSKRTAVERVNSKLKEHRRLNSHCHRGLLKVRLHCLMSVLSLATTALAEADANQMNRVRACTRRVG
jgi:IS5 family transposase